MHSTLLYHHGFARPPSDVFRILPIWWKEMKRQWVVKRSAVRNLQWRAILGLSGAKRRVESAEDVSSRLSQVLPATRSLLVIGGLALLSLIGSALFSASQRTLCQYVSALFFLAGWAVLREGIWHADKGWVLQSAKWTWSTAWPWLLFSVLGGALLSL
jgi:hypothetical protein